MDESNLARWLVRLDVGRVGGDIFPFIDGPPECVCTGRSTGGLRVCIGIEPYRFMGGLSLATAPSFCDIGWKGPDFTLPGVDGVEHHLTDLCGEKGTLIAFICNHCPYVKAILDRLIRDAAELEPLGIATIAISANDAESYPEDGFGSDARNGESTPIPVSIPL